MRYRPLQIVLVFLIAGAIGNLIDRCYLGYVVDFLYFKLIDFPIFNVADCYVTVSAVVLVALLLFYYREEDMELILCKDKK
jgi:signal peptidase II